MRRRSLEGLGVPDFAAFVQSQSLPEFQHEPTTLVQLNVGLYCNQACTHCHVESSPKRQEAMSAEVCSRVLSLLERSPEVRTVDITGGAPEYNPNFRELVKGCRELGKEVIDRCNLTVISEPLMEWLPHFLAEQGVRVVASLPCYTEETVNQQRGSKVFQRSIKGLQTLNSLGFGQEGSGLGLDLVYNPSGPFLPPSQSMLQEAYTEKLHNDFGIAFNNLFTITNMPVKRWADQLYRRGELQDYMQLLIDNFNADTTSSVMCKTMVGVSWDGAIYDCDFNMALRTPLPSADGTPLSLAQLDSFSDVTALKIATGKHCFGCTAGSGSS